MSACRRTWAVRRASVAVVVGTALLAGCSTPPVPGRAVPDWADVQASQEERFEMQMSALEGWLLLYDPFAGGVDTDIAGVAYTHVAFKDRTLDTQTVMALHGSPPALFSRQTDAEPGVTLDELHLAGDEWDYFLLGERFQSLAPTPWVRLPTTYTGAPSDEISGLCEAPGFYHACGLHTMITLTGDSEAGKDARHIVQVAKDGSTHTQTEVTLQALIDSKSVFDISEEVLAEMPEEMRESMIPVDFWLDPLGKLVKMEMNGVFEGGEAGDLLVQTGFEVTGLGSEVEMPAMPAEWDVTTIESDEDVTAFWDAVWELK